MVSTPTRAEGWPSHRRDPVGDGTSAAATARPADGPDGDNAHDEHHHGFDRLEAARIIVAGLCAVALWFEDAVFLSPGTVWARLHDMAASLDPWPVLALGDLLPSAWMNSLPPAVARWIDSYLAIPFSTYAAIGLAFSAWPILREAVHDLLDRRMTMELSMTIAILAAVYTGYFFPAMMITFFVLVAEALEGMTLERGRRAIHDLLETLPRAVNLRRGSEVSRVETDTLRPGDVIVVAPGERIAVDGTIVSGHSFVDESRITGESMSVEKQAGALAYAGSINQSGVIEIGVTRVGHDTSYGKIIEAVEVAERSRAPVTRLADQLAGYIVLFAVAFAALSQYLYRDVSTTISVLVVAGACGVAAGTPLAILGGIGRAARLGAIVKGGVHLEMLGRVDTVVFDKTGTLTFGEPRVGGVFPVPGMDGADVIALAAAAERHSEHPLGKAIVAEAARLGLSQGEPGDFAYTPGHGIATTLDGRRVLVGNAAWMELNGVVTDDVEPPRDGRHTVVFVADNRRLAGAIAVLDVIRPEARAAVADLQAMGLRTLLLSGDAGPVAAVVARDIGIDEVEANLMPQQKLDRIAALRASGRRVAMVGDGINDAPALVTADVGVAMGSGTDVARESADIVLIGNDLSRFVETVRVARRTRTVIWQNFAGTLIVDIAGVAMAMAGYLGVIASVQVHTGSELLFILNAARLLPTRWGQKQSEEPARAPPV